MKAIIIFLLLVSNLTAKEVEKKIKELENTVLDLEIKSLQSMVNLSGELLNEVGYFHTGPGYSGKSADERKYLTTSLFLNANSSLSQDLSVYTTLLGAFFYGQSIADTFKDRDGMTDRIFGDQLKVIKAYFDYSVFNRRVIISAGRLPTIFGPPSHLYSDTKRSGTYPLLAYSLPIDGLAGTWKIIGDSHSKSSLTFRTVFAPITRINGGKPSFSVDGGSSIFDSNAIATDDTLYMAMLEYETRAMPKLADSMLFILQYLGADMNRQKPYMTRIPLPGGAAGTDIYGSAEWEVSFSNDRIYELESFVGYLEFNKLLKTNLDLYVTYKLFDAQSKANVLARMIEQNNYVGPFSVGDTMNLGKLWVANGREIGGNLLVGGRYRFNKRFYLGGEFLYNQIGTFPTTFYALRVTDFYNIVGKGAHFYLGTSVAKGLFNIRLGYSNILSEYDYVTSESFSFAKSKRRIEQLYLQGRIFF